MEAPSCETATIPLMADVLGNSVATACGKGGIASVGQEKPARKRNGIPKAADTSCTVSGSRNRVARTPVQLRR